MPEGAYTAAALTVAVGITVVLRTIPFVAKSAIKDSPLLADLGRWMPLGAVTILAAYCLSLIDLSGPTHGAGPIAGVIATVGVHLWRHNTVLSLITGTTVCVLITNVM